MGVAADDLGGYDRLAGQVGGVRLGIDESFQAWAGEPAFDAARAAGAAARGALPIVTWEPWRPGGGVEQPAYALARIASGAYDDYLRRYAGQISAWGGVVGVRFAHEGNTAAYPWGVGVNGNTAAQAVQAWRHVHDVMTPIAGRHLVWVWCLNVAAPGSAPFGPLYPGDRYVDWAALDGYNGGTALPWGGWRSPQALFGASLAELRAVTARPVVITEVGCVEQGGDKPAWVRSLVAWARKERVRGLVWFEYAKEADWRLETSAAAVSAFRAAVRRAGGGAPPPPAATS